MNPNSQQDLAKVEHWNSLYEKERPSKVNLNDYNDFIIEYYLTKAIERTKPETILEIGCGNSYWLPYLCQKFNVKVFGIDYSEIGCEKARRNLLQHDSIGDIFCLDIFEQQSQNIGLFDFVYSLGVVEHFTDLHHVLERHLAFVKPGGTLFIEIPNLRSIHGLLLWLWNPTVYSKHEIVTKKKLEQVFSYLEIENIDAGYGGFFSLGIVQWEINVRWPKLVPLATNIIYRMNPRMTKLLKKFSIHKGISPLAPYVIISGTKKR